MILGRIGTSALVKMLSAIKANIPHKATLIAIFTETLTISETMPVAVYLLLACGLRFKDAESFNLDALRELPAIAGYQRHKLCKKIPFLQQFIEQFSPSVYPCGLFNFDGVCYQNSVLQAFLHLEDLPFILSPDKPVSREIIALRKRASSSVVVDTKQLRQAMGEPWLRPGGGSPYSFLRALLTDIPLLSLSSRVVDRPGSSIWVKPVHENSCLEALLSVISGEVEILPEILIVCIFKFEQIHNRLSFSPKRVHCPLRNLHLTNSKRVTAKYRLRSTVEDSETIHSFAHVRCGKDWFKAEDETVTRIEESMVVTNCTWIVVYEKQ